MTSRTPPMFFLNLSTCVQKFTKLISNTIKVLNRICTKFKFNNKSPITHVQFMSTALLGTIYSLMLFPENENEVQYQKYNSLFKSDLFQNYGVATLNSKGIDINLHPFLEQLSIMHEDTNYFYQQIEKIARDKLWLIGDNDNKYIKHMTYILLATMIKFSGLVGVSIKLNQSIAVEIPKKLYLIIEHVYSIRERTISNINVFNDLNNTPQNEDKRLQELCNPIIKRGIFLLHRVSAKKEDLVIESDVNDLLRGSVPISIPLSIDKIPKSTNIPAKYEDVAAKLFHFKKTNNDNISKILKEVITFVQSTSLDLDKIGNIALMHENIAKEKLNIINEFSTALLKGYKINNCEVIRIFLKSSFKMLFPSKEHGISLISDIPFASKIQRTQIDEKSLLLYEEILGLGISITNLNEFLTISKESDIIYLTLCSILELITNPILSLNLDKFIQKGLLILLSKILTTKDIEFPECLTQAAVRLTKYILSAATLYKITSMEIMNFYKNLIEFNINNNKSVAEYLSQLIICCEERELATIISTQEWIDFIFSIINNPNNIEANIITAIKVLKYILPIHSNWKQVAIWTKILLNDMKNNFINSLNSLNIKAKLTISKSNSKNYSYNNGNNYKLTGIRNTLVFKEKIEDNISLCTFKLIEYKKKNTSSKFTIGLLKKKTGETYNSTKKILLKPGDEVSITIIKDEDEIRNLSIYKNGIFYNEIRISSIRTYLPYISTREECDISVNLYNTVVYTIPTSVNVSQEYIDLLRTLNNNPIWCDVITKYINDSLEIDNKLNSDNITENEMDNLLSSLFLIGGCYSGLRMGCNVQYPLGFGILQDNPKGLTALLCPQGIGANTLVKEKLENISPIQSEMDLSKISNKKNIELIGRYATEIIEYGKYEKQLLKISAIKALNLLLNNNNCKIFIVNNEYFNNLLNIAAMNSTLTKKWSLIDLERTIILIHSHLRGQNYSFDKITVNNNIINDFNDEIRNNKNLEYYINIDEFSSFDYIISNNKFQMLPKDNTTWTFEDNFISYGYLTHILVDIIQLPLNLQYYISCLMLQQLQILIARDCLLKILETYPKGLILNEDQVFQIINSSKFDLLECDKMRNKIIDNIAKNLSHDKIVKQIINSLQVRISSRSLSTINIENYNITSILPFLSYCVTSLNKTKNDLELLVDSLSCVIVYNNRFTQEERDCSAHILATLLVRFNEMISSLVDGLYSGELKLNIGKILNDQEKKEKKKTKSSYYKNLIIIGYTLSHYITDASNTLLDCFKVFSTTKKITDEKNNANSTELWPIEVRQSFLDWQYENNNVLGWGYTNNGCLGIELTYTFTNDISNPFEIIKNFSNYLEIVAGYKYSYILSRNGKVFLLGKDKTLKGYSSKSSPENLDVFDNKFITNIQTKGNHTMALDINGSLWSWGKGKNGQHGNGSSQTIVKPTIIETLQNYKIRAFSCGMYTCAAITDKGSLVTWGSVKKARFWRDKNSFLPKEIKISNKVSSVSCGYTHTLVLIEDGMSIWAWGSNYYGELGIGNTSKSIISSPKQIEADPNWLPIKKIETGDHVSSFLSTNNVLYTFGYGKNGCLGLGTASNVLIPNPVIIIEPVLDMGIISGNIMKVIAENCKIYQWGKITGKTVYEPISVKLHSIPSVKDKKFNRISLSSSHSIVYIEENIFKTDLISDELLPLKNIDNMDLITMSNILNGYSDTFASVFNYINIDPSIGPTFGIEETLWCITKETKYRILRDYIKSSSHFNSPKKVILNRYAAERSSKLFYQLCKQLRNTRTSKLFSERAYEVVFKGEGAVDVGGPYKESISQICEELQTGKIQIVQRIENKNSIFPNPNIKSSVLFKFLGTFFGISIRTKVPLSLYFPDCFWKLICGAKITIDDLLDIDEAFVNSHKYLLQVVEEGISEDDFEYLPLDNFPPIQYENQTIELCYKNIKNYTKIAISNKLNEWDFAITHIKKGLHEFIPSSILALFTPQEIGILICGEPTIDWGLLKNITSYSGFDETDNTIVWLWEVLQSLSNEDGSNFLRFVSGSTRLAHEGDLEQFSINSSYSIDTFPTAATCFFTLTIPEYTSKEILEEKIVYAIRNCTSIDLDQYDPFPDFDDNDDIFIESDLMME